MDPQPVRVPVEKNRGGEWVTFGDEQYRVPPLAFRAVIEMQEDVMALASVVDARPTPAQMETVTKLVHSALARNYPSKTLQEVEEMLDLENYAPVLTAVLRIGGFKKESADASGEAAASTGMQPTAL